jgi:hypothetical protein
MRAVDLESKYRTLDQSLLNLIFAMQAHPFDLPKLTILCYP